MKEQYFTEDNIIDKSNDLLIELESRYNIEKVEFKPDSAALLILDMQNFFLDRHSHAFIPAAEVIISSINELSVSFLKDDMPVVYTRHINTVENAGMMAVWWNELIQEENIISNISLKVLNENSVVFQKEQYDAFFNTKLEDYLKKRNIKQLIVTGVMTHLCCESTIRAAFVRGFEVFFPIDGTATYNWELHRSSFITLSHGFAIPCLIKHFLNS